MTHVKDETLRPNYIPCYIFYNFGDWEAVFKYKMPWQ